MLVIESHAHVYAPDVWRYPPRPDARRPAPAIGTLAHLREECQQNGVSAAVAIQTVSFYGWDNRYLTDLAAGEGSWLAAVCALDAEDPNSPHVLRSFSEAYGIRGVRILTTSSGHLDAPEVRTLCGTAADLGLVINVLAGRSQVDEVGALLDAFPSHPIVIEHALGINRSPDPDVTVERLRTLAASRNAVVELCDLPTISQAAFPFVDVHQHFLHIIEAFGPDRCVWGSSFPGQFWVGKASQAEALEVFARHLDLPAEARADVLGRTAARLWFPELTPADASTVGEHAVTEAPA